MVNLTLSIDEQLLRRARVKAVEEGRTVNAVVREQLEQYVDDRAASAVAAELLELSERTDAGSGTEGRTWRREELYEERSGVRGD